MLENIRNVITHLPIDRLRPNLGGHIPSCSHVPQDLVAMATATGIEHCAVMGVWRPNARTDFDEIRYTATR